VDQRALVGAHELLELVLVARAVLGLDDDLRRVDVGDRAGAARDDDVAGVERRAALHAGAHDGASVRSSGTAWRCMFEPMSARLASSCSRNGIIAVATDQIWSGETSMSSTSFGAALTYWPAWVRHTISSP